VVRAVQRSGSSVADVFVLGYTINGTGCVQNGPGAFEVVRGWPFVGARVSGVVPTRQYPAPVRA
jgi:hypothetical protein